MTATQIRETNTTGVTHAATDNGELVCNRQISTRVYIRNANAEQMNALVTCNKCRKALGLASGHRSDVKSRFAVNGWGAGRS